MAISENKIFLKPHGLDAALCVALGTHPRRRRCDLSSPRRTQGMRDPADRPGGKASVCASAEGDAAKKRWRRLTAGSTPLPRGQLPTRGLVSLRLSKQAGPSPARCRLTGLSGHLVGAQFPSCPSGQTHNYRETESTLSAGPRMQLEEEGPESEKAYLISTILIR